MASLNKVLLIGHLGADPETKRFQNGDRIVTFRLATSESWKDRQSGERKERTEWHSISVLSDGLCGVVERYLKKGSKVYLEGQLRTRKWQDQSGTDRYSTEIVLNGPKAMLVMLDGRPADGSGGSSGTRAAGQSHQDGGGDTWSGSDLDDEVPF